MAYRDFEEFLESLNAQSVRYLVGGAHALALHARPRATQDLDVFVEPTKRNAERTVEAVRAFFGGSDVGYVSVENLLDPHAIVQLGVAPVRIDLLSRLEVPGGFRAAWKRRVDAPFGSVPAHYLSREDLIHEKQHWARAQDLADLEVLERPARRRRRKKR